MRISHWSTTKQHLVLKISRGAVWNLHETFDNLWTEQKQIEISNIDLCNECYKDKKGNKMQRDTVHTITFLRCPITFGETIPSFSCNQNLFYNSPILLQNQTRPITHSNYVYFM